jgi:hypothetical protein
MNKLILLTAGLLISVSFYAIPDIKSYYNRKGNKLVIIQLRDNIALVEYCFLDYKNKYHTKFDTLQLNQQVYAGKFSKLRFHEDVLIFKPGKIILKEGIPDTSYNKQRNLGYIQFMESKFTTAFDWTQIQFNEFPIEQWKSKIRIDPAKFKKEVQLRYDSLNSLYTSQKITGNFKKVIIRDNRICPRKYLESEDTTEILRIWRLLSTGYPSKKNMFPYLMQYPITIIPLAEINFDAALLSSIVLYPVLIVSERFVINRIYASSTYKISFIPKNNKDSNTDVEVRNAIIKGNNYNYKLPFIFEKEILHIRDSFDPK